MQKREDEPTERENERGRDRKKDHSGWAKLADEEEGKKGKKAMMTRMGHLDSWLLVHGSCSLAKQALTYFTLGTVPVHVPGLCFHFDFDLIISRVLFYRLSLSLLSFC